MFDTNFVFKKGKLTVLLDGSPGSSGKGAIASFICEHADYDFACNSFSAQAGHWIKLDNGKSYFYQTFNSCAYQSKCKRLLVGPDAAIELPALIREMKENDLPISKIGIHPLATIIQEKDMAYERGEVDFDGNKYNKLEDGTKKNGSTCHGTGPARVRKMLRRKDTLYAKDVPELKEMICDVSSEIISRLESGQKGLLEIAQGFPLSLNYKFHPACTNRNVTVSAALDGMFLPPIYAGNVILNYRTFPIRISSFKYIGDNGKFLTWAEVEEYKATGKKFETYVGDSGGWYEDQTEVDWDYVTKLSESDTKIMEITSVTKLPRRVATFTKIGLDDSIKFNRTGHDIFLSINFMNYIDGKMNGIRGNGIDKLTNKAKQWLDENISKTADKYGAKTLFIGTGAKTDDKVMLV
jgi:hypothetical protein